MGKDIRFKLEKGTKISEEEISMIEEARSKEPVYDEDNPEIDPSSTPEQFEALMRAVGERNRRIAKMNKILA